MWSKFNFTAIVYSYCMTGNCINSYCIIIVIKEKKHNISRKEA